MEMRMATMMRMRTLRDAAAACREHLRDCRDNAENGVLPQPVYVLRPDGHSDKYAIDSTGKITRSRVAGHVTRGMWVDPSDIPCVID